MKKLSYLLFPKAMIIVGIIFLLLTVYKLLNVVLAFLLDAIKFEELFGEMSSTIGFLIIGLILITSRSTIIFNSSKREIIKKMKILFIPMSNEIIKVPNTCNQLIAKGKVKKGKSYVNLVVPLSYEINSYDLYLKYGNRLKKLISTNFKKGRLIAETLQETMDINYKNC